LVTETDGRYVVKIADLGLSREVQDNLYESSDDTFPVKWSPPEVIKYRQFSSASDVWSFGIALWEIFEFGTVPYPTMSNMECVENILQGYRLPKPERCPNELYNLMRQCWSPLPDDRPKFPEIFSITTQILEREKNFERTLTPIEPANIALQQSREYDSGKREEFYN